MRRLTPLFLLAVLCVSCADDYHSVDLKEGFRIYNYGTARKLLLNTDTGETWFLDDGKEKELAWHPVEFLDYESVSDLKEGVGVSAGPTPIEIWRKKIREKMLSQQ